MGEPGADREQATASARAVDCAEAAEPGGAGAMAASRGGRGPGRARTALGRAFRATSDDPVTARLMGIRPERLFATATGIAMVVVTIAGLYLGMRANFDPSIGPARLIYAFEAVIIGGLGSLWGTLAGGIIIGVAQTVGAAVDPEWQILSGHLAFLVVLAVRPRGLFPRAVD